MGPYYKNQDSAALFKNDKGNNPKRPDYRGKASVNGKDYQIAAWVNDTKDGEKYLSIKFDSPEHKPQKGVFPDLPEMPKTETKAEEKVVEKEIDDFPF